MNKMILRFTNVFCIILLTLVGVFLLNVTLITLASGYRDGYEINLPLILLASLAYAYSRLFAKGWRLGTLTSMVVIISLHLCPLAWLPDYIAHTRKEALLLIEHPGIGVSLLINQDTLAWNRVKNEYNGIFDFIYLLLGFLLIEFASLISSIRQHKESSISYQDAWKKLSVFNRNAIISGLIVVAIVIPLFFKKTHLDFELVYELPIGGGPYRYDDWFGQDYAFYHSKQFMQGSLFLENFIEHDHSDNEEQAENVFLDTLDFNQYSYVAVNAQKVTSMYYSYKSTYFDDRSSPIFSCRKRGKKCVFVEYDRNSMHGWYIYRVKKDVLLRGMYFHG